MANYTVNPNATITEFFTTYPNEQLMGGYYGPLMLSAIFTIMFATLLQRTTGANAFTAASFTTFLASTLFVVIDLVTTPIWMITTIMLIVSVGVVMSAERGGGVGV